MAKIPTTHDSPRKRFLRLPGPSHPLPTSLPQAFFTLSESHLYHDSSLSPFLPLSLPARFGEEQVFSRRSSADAGVPRITVFIRLKRRRGIRYSPQRPSSLPYAAFASPLCLPSTFGASF